MTVDFLIKEDDADETAPVVDPHSVLGDLCPRSHCAGANAGECR